MRFFSLARVLAFVVAASILAQVALGSGKLYVLTTRAQLYFVDVENSGKWSAVGNPVKHVSPATQAIAFDPELRMLYFAAELLVRPLYQHQVVIVGLNVSTPNPSANVTFTRTPFFADLSGSNPHRLGLAWDDKNRTLIASGRPLKTPPNVTALVRINPATGETVQITNIVGGKDSVFGHSTGFAPENRLYSIVLYEGPDVIVTVNVDSGKQTVAYCSGICPLGLSWVPSKRMFYGWEYPSDLSILYGQVWVEYFSPFTSETDIYEIQDSDEIPKLKGSAYDPESNTLYGIFAYANDFDEDPDSDGNRYYVRLLFGTNLDGSVFTFRSRHDLENEDARSIFWLPDPA